MECRIISKNINILKTRGSKWIIFLAEKETLNFIEPSLTEDYKNNFQLECFDNSEKVKVLDLRIQSELMTF